jgi:hypothetical protein
MASDGIRELIDGSGFRFFSVCARTADTHTLSNDERRRFNLRCSHHEYHTRGKGVSSRGNSLHL